MAFSLQDTLHDLRASCRCRSSASASAAAARGRALWRQIQADVYGHPVETSTAEEGAAYGAALLAGVGGGVWPTVDDACDAVVRVATRVAPEPATGDHGAAVPCIPALYPALQQRCAALMPDADGSGRDA